MDDQNKLDRPNGEAEPSAEENVQTRLDMSSDDLASSFEENGVVLTWGKEKQLQNNRRDTNEEREVETFEMTEFRGGNSVHQTPVQKCQNQENEEADSEMSPKRGLKRLIQNNGPDDTDNQLSKFKCDPTPYKTTENNELDKKVKNTCGNKKEHWCEMSSEDDFSMKTQLTDPLWYKTPGSNSFVAQPSKRRVEQAIECLRLVESRQENGQYDEALSWCETTLHSLCPSDDINLYMMFCSNIMQLHYVMGNIDQAINTYFDRCLVALESPRNDIDPKVIQTIMDLHSLCFKKFTPTEEQK